VLLLPVGELPPHPQQDRDQAEQDHEKGVVVDRENPASLSAEDDGKNETCESQYSRGDERSTQPEGASKAITVDRMVVLSRTEQRARSVTTSGLAMMGT
jgi:hypothetical protein